MTLGAYLDRIAYDGPLKVDLETLRALHRAHLLAIPYEAYDTPLQRVLTIDPAAAYEKIVGRGRGGWCYEMNGLFGWALGEIGFSVTRLSTGPMRADGSGPEIGNHLVLRIDDFEAPWIADVGFADGPLEPYPVVEGPFSQRQFPFRLERLEDGWWKFHNHPLGMSPAFHMRLDLGDEALLARRCVWLNTAADSQFVQNAVAFMHTETGQKSLIGRKFRRLDGEARSTRLIASAEDLQAVLLDEFALDLPEVKTLWPRICARHEELFGIPT